MTDTPNRLDATRCPLCEKANECAIATGRDPNSCWCMSAVMDAGALARIPAEAQGLVCICARCAAGERTQGGPPL